MILFAHDDAMVRLVGEECYVRWMDDQNLAVGNKAEGLVALREVGRSLARLHLSPNAGKSKIFTLDEARRHYHLDLNRMLDDAEGLAEKASASKAARLRFRQSVRAIWIEARPHDGVGEFGKVLKRIYRLAGLAQLPLLRDRAASDILADPTLTARVADYYRCTGTVSQYLDFVESVMENPEQIYPDVNVQLTSSLLRLEPSSGELKRIRQITAVLLQMHQAMPGSQDCAASAALLVLRFGDFRARRLLKRLVDSPTKLALTHVVRAAAFVYASDSMKSYEEILGIAGRTHRNHLSTLVRLIAAIRDYKEVPERYRNRLNVSWDPVGGLSFIDMRVVLTAKLLMLNENEKVKRWVSDRFKALLQEPISDYDRALVLRVMRSRSGSGKSKIGS